MTRRNEHGAFSPAEAVTTLCKLVLSRISSVVPDFLAISQYSPIHCINNSTSNFFSDRDHLVLGSLYIRVN